MQGDVDVVVIGGGLAGLAAATYLGRAGKRVVLLEKSRDVGGRAATQAHGEYRLNLGPHALYRAGAGLRVLKELGVGVAGKTPPTSGLLTMSGDAFHAFPSGVVALLTTGLFRFSERIEAAQMLQRLLRGIDPAPLYRTTARAWLDQALRSPAVRRFIEALIRLSTYTNAPHRLSAGAAVEQLKLALTANVLYLDGGWQTLVDGLAAAARDAGVTMRTGVKAQSIEIQDGAARAVRIEGGDPIAASAVLVAATPAAARALSAGDPGLEGVAARAAEAIPVKAACLDVALSSLPRPKAFFALGIDRPLYFSVHSVTAKLAPEGGALMQAAKYVNPDEETDPKADEEELLAVCDRMQPGWRDVTVERRFLPSLVVMNDVVRAEVGGAAGRPDSTATDIRNFYLAGDWVGPEGMLADASLSSAARAARHILKS